MSEMHLISKEHLDKLGDYARDISGTTEDMTVDEMLEVFDGAESGGNGGVNVVVAAPNVIIGKVKTVEKVSVAINGGVSALINGMAIEA